MVQSLVGQREELGGHGPVEGKAGDARAHRQRMLLIEVDFGERGTESLDDRLTFRCGAPDEPYDELVSTEPAADVPWPEMSD